MLSMGTHYQLCGRNIAMPITECINVGGASRAD